MAPVPNQQAFDLALQHHRARRFPEAEQLYRQILVTEPKHFDAMHNLGALCFQTKRYDIAIDLIRRAIVLRPGSPEAHCNLGNSLRESGQLDAAIAAYHQAIALRPNYAEAYGNLGNALNLKGRFDEGASACRQSILLRPGYAEAHYTLGNALQALGRIEEAIASYRQAIALRPSLPEAYNNLGNALKKIERSDEAIAAYRQAIALRANFAEAYCNLGNALLNKLQTDDAIAAYRTAIAVSPDYASAYSNLGTALHDKGQFGEAVAAHQRALALDPNVPEFHNNLGNVLKDQGQLDEAIAAYRRAVALNPQYTSADSSLVYTLLFHPAYDAKTVAQEHRRWNRQHAEPLQALIRDHSNDRSPGRRLRVGYVSPDFRDHVVGRNLLPVLRHHDRRHFDITCYATVPLRDAMTLQFERSADHWRSIAGLSDEEAADQIRKDQIDVLVDLSLHMVHNRLLIFARKPAPVQVTFAGYPGSTGLSTIDYRLSDPYLDPPGMDESIYSEQTVRLPDSFWCYDPLEDRDVSVNSLPALKNGFITFGCLNNFCKINPTVLAVWAQVMKQVENSRLMLLMRLGSHQQDALASLWQQGIDPARVEIIPPQSRRSYLESYHRIDLGLDSFPYNGHTTSLDSLWMGVPVITLVGERVVSRAGWCQLSNLGLGELAGTTSEQFAKISVALAGDLPKLARLRATLRQRMEQSPLMDAPKFTRNIESAYRQMWRKWCGSA
jgi:predicted O-linked N-acetylglucosamine transferase (SPINDLY family)